MSENEGRSKYNRVLVVVVGPEMTTLLLRTVEEEVGLEPFRVVNQVSYHEPHVIAQTYQLHGQIRGRHKITNNVLKFQGYMAQPIKCVGYKTINQKSQKYYDFIINILELLIKDHTPIEKKGRIKPRFIICIPMLELGL